MLKNNLKGPNGSLGHIKICVSFDLSKILGGSLKHIKICPFDLSKGLDEYEFRSMSQSIILVRLDNICEQGSMDGIDESFHMK